MTRKFVFKWDPESLSVHVDAMDKDHQVLIKMMNDIFELYKRKAQRSEIGQAMKTLGAFVVEHFTREEKYFESIRDYPDVDIHKAIHKKLVTRYTTYLESYLGGAELTDDFFFFLKAWLIAHIEGVDMRYGVLSQAA